MRETRSRLSEELTRRLTRWRNTAVPIVQAALAAGLSWLVAVHLVDHRAPFFAPVAAVVCLGVTLGQRLRRVIELIVGVGLGARSQGRRPDSHAPSEYASQPHGETGHHIQADPRRDLDTPVVTNARKPPDRSPTGLRNTVGGFLDAVPSQTRI